MRKLRQAPSGQPFPGPAQHRTVALVGTNHPLVHVHHHEPVAGDIHRPLGEVSPPLPASERRYQHGRAQQAQRGIVDQDLGPCTETVLPPSLGDRQDHQIGGEDRQNDRQDEPEQ